MFEYKKDKYDLQAEADGEHALKELFTVCNEFAALTGTKYRRTITDWCVRSDFDRVWYDKDGFHYMRSAKKVKLNYHGFESSEAVELAWALEDEWNKRVEAWDKALAELDELDDIDEIERREDIIDSDIAAGLDSMAETVEVWLDSAECWYFSGEYADQLREEVA